LGDAYFMHVALFITDCIAYCVQTDHL